MADRYLSAKSLAGATQEAVTGSRIKNRARELSRKLKAETGILNAIKIIESLIERVVG